MVVVHNEERHFQFKKELAHRQQPQRILLDSSAQPLMLGKIAINNLELIDVDFDPCPY
jgi:hypothetical protein